MPDDYSWDSQNVAIACGVSIGAGLATGIGGLVVFAPQLLASVPKGTILAIALAISAGVMLYVSFIEIFVKSHEAIATQVENEAGAAAITTSCFFFGMLICVGLEWIVHKLHHRFSPSGLDSHNMPNELPAGVQPLPAGGRSEQDPAERSWAGGIASWLGGKGSKRGADASAVVVEMEEAAGAGAGAGSPPARTVPDGDAHDMGEEERSQLGRMGAMTALAIALHNFPEGLATFLATVSDPSVGIALGVAIAVHNIPEGVCVAMPMYYSTGSRKKGFIWSLISGVTEPIGGIVGYAILQPVFTDFVFGIIFAMVGGMMVFIVLHELLPTAHRYMPHAPGQVTFFVVLGMAIMALSLVLFAL